MLARLGACACTRGLGLGAVAAGAGGRRLSVTAAATLDVLYEDKHLIVVNKSAGVLSQGAYAEQGAEDMLALVKAHLVAAAGKSKKPVYVGLVHRLDRNVSGAMVLAKRSKAAARLGEQFRQHSVTKVYVAMVLGELPRGSGPRTLRHALAFRGQGRGNVTRVLGDAPAPAGASRDSDLRTTATVAAASAAAPAGSAVVGELRYEPLIVVRHPRRPGEAQTLLRIELVSGRKHQIRAQLSHIGHPIVGDVKYGAPVALRDKSIALHCRTLAFRHPTRGPALDGEERPPEEPGRRMAFHAPLPGSWRARFGDAVVGAVEAVQEEWCVA